jgi:hypothetical protein
MFYCMIILLTDILIQSYIKFPITYFYIAVFDYNNRIYFRWNTLATCSRNTHHHLFAQFSRNSIKEIVYCLRQLPHDLIESSSAFFRVFINDSGMIRNFNARLHCVRDILHLAWSIDPMRKRPSRSTSLIAQHLAASRFLRM